MTDSYFALTLAMWIFMVFFLVSGVFSITWDKKYGKEKLSYVSTAILAFITFLITTARFIIALKRQTVQSSDFILMVIWLFASITQFYRLKYRK